MTTADNPTPAPAGSEPETRSLAEIAKDAAQILRTLRAPADTDAEKEPDQ